MLQHVSECFSFFRLSNISLHIYTTLSLYIHLLINIWLIFSSWGFANISSKQCFQFFQICIQKLYANKHLLFIHSQSHFYFSKLSVLTPQSIQSIFPSSLLFTFSYQILQTSQGNNKFLSISPLIYIHSSISSFPPTTFHRLYCSLSSLFLLGHCFISYTFFHYCLLSICKPAQINTHSSVTGSQLTLTQTKMGFYSIT